MNADKGTFVRQAIFQAKLATDDSADKVSVKNLQVHVNAGYDAWGREKSQPSLLTVSLHMAKPFDCEGDALDKTTVHYGHLSKNIKSRFENLSEHRKTEKLARDVASCMVETAGKAELKGLEVDVFYPKGILNGDGAGFSLSQYQDADGTLYESKVLYLRNLRIPCLIGVNPNERLMKQPVIVNVWVEGDVSHFDDAYNQLEHTVVDIISESFFETIETLAKDVVERLRVNFFKAEDCDAYVRLRVEKPIAVPIADAPAIEILRPVGRAAIGTKVGPEQSASE